jgi:uncharacterized protein (DUF2345 family)
MLKILTIVSLLISSLWSSEYRDVAENFLKYRGVDKTIESSETLSKGSITVGYIYNLSGGGYIVVPNSKYISPIKAYSFSSSKIGEFYRNFIINDLYGIEMVGSNLNRAIDSKVSDRWSFLGDSSRVTNRVLYSTSSERLTETNWNQEYPYNIFFPKVGSDTTVTGCVQTALGQVMKYHSFPDFGSGITRNRDAEIYDSTKQLSRTEDLEAVLYRNYNWEIMDNDYSGDENSSSRDEVALLMMDLAVLNGAKLGVAETSASMDMDEFVKRFFYSTYISDMSSKNSETVYSDILETIKSQIDLTLPVLVSIPGHMVVADAYQSDDSGEFIHLNMGWGGYENGFYNLSEDIEAGGDTYTQYSGNNLSIIYNIKPCSESAGDCFQNLEEGDTLSDWENLTLETDDSISDWQNLTLESGDSSSDTEISGNLADFEDSDSFYVYLSGDTTLSRDSQYWNIALYAVDGTLVSESRTSDISETLVSGKYLVEISWLTSSGSYYQLSDFNRDYSVSISTTALSEGEKSAIENATEKKLISGNLADFNDSDTFEVYFSEETIISRESTGWNIALYKLDGTLVSESRTADISETLDSGKYLVKVSWKSSGGTYSVLSSYSADYSISTITTPLSEIEKSSIETETEREIIYGNLNSFKDVDEFELYLSGYTTLSRESENWSMALYKIDGTLIEESFTEDISQTLDAGKYLVKISWKSSEGTYFVLSSYNADYSLSVLTTPLSESEKSSIDGELQHSPVIDTQLEDMVISKPIDIILNIYDGDGDAMNLSAESRISVVELGLKKNILTLSPRDLELASDIELTLTAGEESVYKSFTILTYSSEVGFGDQFQLEGNFSSSSETLSHEAILSGECTISGYRGYSNQAFFIKVSDEVNGTVADWSDQEITVSNLESNLYTIETKTGNYSLDENHSEYTLSISCDDNNLSIEEIASILGIDTSGKEDLDGAVESNTTSGEDTNTTSGEDTNTTSGEDTNTTSGEDTNTTSGEDTNTTSGEDTNTTSGEDTNTTSGEDTNTTSGEDTNTTSGGDTNTTSGEDTNTTSGEDTNTTSGEDTNTTSGEDTNTSSGEDTNTSSGDENSSLQISISLKAGWSLVANPVNIDINLSEVANISHSFKYVSNSWHLWNSQEDSESYPRFTTFESGVGYWIYTDVNTSMDIPEGDSAVCPEVSGLESGWNLIGSCEISDFDSFFGQDEKLYLIYKYSDSWSVIGRDSSINSLIEASEYQFLDNIDAVDGFWLYIAE